MSEATHEEVRSEKRSTKHASRDEKPAPVAVVDPLMRSLGNDYDLEKRVGNTRATSEIEHRAGLIAQFGMLRQSLLVVVETGVTRGLGAIAEPEIVPTNETARLLAFAASLVLSGCAGAVAGAVGNMIANKIEQKFVENSVKDAIKQAFKPGQVTAPASLKDIKRAFRDALGEQVASSWVALGQNWATVNDRLSSLSTKELEATAAPVDLAQVPTIIEEVANQTVVAWTNFLARAVHGGMPPRDPWNPKRGLPLKGHAEPTDGDLHRANVEPRGLDEALGLNSGAGSEATFGVMEIYLSLGGHFANRPGYGMRLENVGPDVRNRMRAFGAVRDLPINKIVRVCDFRPTVPVPHESMLITADGHVREYRRGGNQLVHRDSDMDIGECLDRLVERRPNEACHVDTRANETAVVDYAEAAQSLSLTLLQD